MPIIIPVLQIRKPKLWGAQLLAQGPQGIMEKL